MEVVPEAVQRGQEVILRCHYDLERAPLYSVKWYRGRYEFYRYSPNEENTNKIFNITGIHVDVSYLLYIYTFLLYLYAVDTRCIYMHTYNNTWFHIRRCKYNEFCSYNIRFTTSVLSDSTTLLTHRASHTHLVG